MEEWIKCPLGDILNFRRGHDLPKTSMIPGDIPVAGSNGIIGFHNVSTPISPCITIGRSGNVGTPYIYDKCWAHNTVLYIDDYKGNDPKYLYYLLKTLPLASFGGGSAVPTLNRNHIHPLEVDFCRDIELQKKIAGILSKIDDKIEINNQINDNLEQQAQALYKSWFVDFEPFKDSDFVESDLGLIPKGWSTGSIYKYVNVIYGAPYKSTLFNENKEGYPLIRIRDLKTFSPQFYTTEVLPQTEYIKSGDVVAGMDAEFIPCLWQGETGVLNQRCCKFVGKDKDINNLFVLNLVKPELEYVQSYKTGTTVSHLGKADIDRFIVILPDEVIVHQFSKICRSLLDEQNKCALEIRRLTNLRDTLLPKLMSGELKINEIDC